LADYFHKNGICIIYSLEDWSGSTNISIGQYCDYIELKIEYLNKLRRGNVKKSVSKLINELKDIRECIQRRNKDSLNEHLELFNKTISNIKYDYFVNLDPTHKMEYKLLSNLISKIETIGDIYSINDGDFVNKLAIGDILLYFNMSSRNSFFTKTITKFTKSFIIHAGIYTGGGNILEANETSGSVDNIKIRLTESNQIIVVMRGNLNANQIEMISKIARNFKENTSGYGYKELIGQAIFQKTGIFPNIFTNKHAYFCSELVDEVYKKIGYPLTAGKTSQYATPGDIIDSRYLRVAYILDNLNDKTYTSIQDFLKDLINTKEIYAFMNS
jgi:uncharacterized protein YycO